MKLFGFVVFIAFMVAHNNAQPMDWSHHFAYNDNDAVSSFILDKSGNLLCIGEFALHGNVLLLTDDELNGCRNHFNAFDYNGFEYSLLKKNGDVLLYKKDTVYIFRNGDYQTPYSKIADTLVNNVLSSVEMNDGAVIIGTFYNNLLLLKDEQITLFEWPAGLEDHLLPCLYDSRQRLWAKTWNSGIYCYENSQWVKYDRTNSGLLSNKFGDVGTNVLEDKGGNIIAVSNDESNDSSGIFSFDGNTWKRRGVDPSKSYYNCIRCVAIDSNDAMWLGTLNGMVRIKGDSTYKYTSGDIRNMGSPDGFIRDIVVDNNNRVFVGTFHNCMYILDQSESFSCKNNQHVEITSPSENTQFHVSDTLIARWDSYGFCDSVLLQYRIDTGTWMPCYSVTANPNRRNQFFYRWVIPATLTPGSYIFRVSDSRNNAAYDTLTFLIVGESQNVSPVFSTISDTLKVNQNTTVACTLSATDADKDTLTYQALDLPQWITFSDSTLTINPVSSSTTQNITVIVSDGKGGSDTAIITVVPVPPVSNLDVKNSRYKKMAAVTITKKTINISLQGEHAAQVKNAVLIDCSGKLIAEFVPAHGGFRLDRSVINVSKGMYTCIVYSNDGKVFFKKKLQLLE